MKQRTRVAWALVFLCGGCREEAGTPIDREPLARHVADAICESYFACDCDVEHPAGQMLGTEEACADAILPAIERAVAEAELYGLKYYSDCIGRMQNAFELVCGEAEITDPEQAAQILYAAASCKLVAGDAIKE